MRITRVIFATILLLLVPLIAMLFTDEVQWNLFDFLVMGTLLLIAGLAYEFTTQKINAKYRPIVIAVIVALFLLIWAELAVGLIGTPFAGS